MPEFIVAKYPDSRDVFVDGANAGLTNTTLAIGDPGVYDIDLGEPRNYTPASYDEVEITGHGAADPKIFDFKPVSSVGSATNGDANDDDT